MNLKVALNMNKRPAILKLSKSGLSSSANLTDLGMLPSLKLRTLNSELPTYFGPLSFSRIRFPSYPSCHQFLRWSEPAGPLF